MIYIQNKGLDARVNLDYTKVELQSILKHKSLLLYKSIKIVK
jgi:hypothetical protein